MILLDAETSSAWHFFWFLSFYEFIISTLSFFNRKSLPLEEVAARAKAATGDQDIRKTWILFGDPTSRLRWHLVIRYYGERHWKVVIARNEATWQSLEIASLRSQWHIVNVNLFMSFTIVSLHPETPSPLGGEGWGEGDENRKPWESEP